MVDDHVFIIVCTVLFLVSGQDWIWRFFSALLFLVEADSRFCPKEVKRPPSCSPFDEPSESPSVYQRPSNAPSVSNEGTQECKLNYGKEGGGGKGSSCYVRNSLEYHVHFTILIQSEQLHFLVHR